MAEKVTATLIDAQMPRFDATRIEHRVVAGTPAEIYPIVLDADFVEAVARRPLPRTLIAVRAGAERAFRAVTKRPAPALDDQAELRLSDLTGEGEWVLLGTDPGAEIAFGAVGRFWAGETRWLEIESGEFAGFSRPGYARIACNISLRPYGAERTLVSYEARTQATDPDSLKAFRRYWRFVDPFVGIVMRATLSLIADMAAAQAAGDSES